MQAQVVCQVVRLGSKASMVYCTAMHEQRGDSIEHAEG